ncbi:unnamed protein product [Soboliphyme baturini]|uniref:K1109 n=1 Tax=Soboliphyme baturini TaxID=241478 RepID=A0A183ICR0_9BILA|nr:unnamed protein product [Soboliphyme baturini]
MAESTGSDVIDHGDSVWQMIKSSTSRKHQSDSDAENSTFLESGSIGNFPHFKQETGSTVSNEDSLSVLAELSVEDYVSNVVDDGTDPSLFEDVSLYEEMFSPYARSQLAEGEEVTDNSQDIISKGARVLQKKVCILTFRLRGVQFDMLSKADECRIKICIPFAEVTELNQICLEEFHRMLSIRDTSNAGGASVEQQCRQFPIKILLTAPNSNSGSMEALFSNLRFSINSANLANLSAFLQDSRPRKNVMPISIKFSNVQMEVTDPIFPPFVIALNSGSLVQGTSS